MLHVYCSEDEELINIFQTLEKERTTGKVAKTINGRLEEYFCTKLVFKLGKF